MRWQSDGWRDLPVPVFSLWPPSVCQPHLVASDRIRGLPSRRCLSQSCKSNPTVWCRFTDYLILPISACSCLYFPHYPDGYTVSLLFTAHISFHWEIVYFADQNKRGGSLIIFGPIPCSLWMTKHDFDYPIRENRLSLMLKEILKKFYCFSNIIFIVCWNCLIKIKWSRDLWFYFIFFINTHFYKLQVICRESGYDAGLNKLIN